MINFSVTDQASAPNTTTITITSTVNTNKIHIVGIVSNETNTMTMYLNNQQVTPISVNPFIYLLAYLLFIDYNTYVAHL